MNNNPPSFDIEFECSFCGYTQILPRSHYKILNRRLNDKHWTEYISVCKKCGREMRVIKYASDNNKH